MYVCDQLHLNYHNGLSLLKDVRAYAYASKESWESWVIAIDQEKGHLLL